VAVTHFAFQIMVGCGTLLALVSVLAAWLAWRRRGPPVQRRFLELVMLCGPLGLIAVEAGWTVTEVGRQPWIIHGVMLTRDALTPVPGLIVPLLVVSGVYLLLGLIVIALLRRQVFQSLPAAEPRAPGEAA
jgi:cytochrome d ubiquinol oxidase subunit I